MLAGLEQQDLQRLEQLHSVRTVNPDYTEESEVSEAPEAQLVSPWLLMAQMASLSWSQCRTNFQQNFPQGFQQTE